MEEEPHHTSGKNDARISNFESFLALRRARKAPPAARLMNWAIWDLSMAGGLKATIASAASGKYCSKTTLLPTTNSISFLNARNGSHPEGNQESRFRSR